MRAIAAAAATGLAVLAISGCGGVAQVAHEAEAVGAASAVHADHANADHASAGPAVVHTTTRPGAAHAAHAPAMAAAPLPGESLFHLSGAFTDSRGAALALPDLRGEPSVFVMFYGDCTTACPLLVRAAELIQDELPTDLAERVSFVMVTFATTVDTPAKLAAYAAERGLDRPNWHWLVGSDLTTRSLAAMLGVQYRDLGNGMFSHSNLVTVLDADGVPVARLEGLGADPAPAVAALLTATTY